MDVGRRSRLPGGSGAVRRSDPTPVRAARLLPGAADRAGAPPRAVVPGVVVEGPPAGAARAHLEPLPVVVALGRADALDRRGDQPPEGGARGGRQPAVADRHLQPRPRRPRRATSSGTCSPPASTQARRSSRNACSRVRSPSSASSTPRARAPGPEPGGRQLVLAGLEVDGVQEVLQRGEVRRRRLPPARLLRHAPSHILTTETPSVVRWRSRVPPTGRTEEDGWAPAPAWPGREPATAPAPGCCSRSGSRSPP